MSQTEEKKFKLSNVVLYSKGWYKTSDDIWGDLLHILKLDDYTPFTKYDVYSILLGQTQECSFRWCELRQVMNGIHPNQCWKYGYYTKQNKDWSYQPNKELPDYDMPTAFIYYVISNLRDLDNKQWIVKTPKWTKYPKNPDIHVSKLIEMFNKRKK